MDVLPGPKVTLDLDTLFHVLVFASDRSTLWSLMQTCHSLYDAGSPYLLSYPIYLKTRAELELFCKWMLPRSNERYLRLFRQIRISNESISNDEEQEFSGAEILAEILRKATSLNELSLELPASFDDLTVGTPALREAIQDLNIETLSITNASNQMMDFLSTMRSPIVSLDVHLINVSWSESPRNNFKFLCLRNLVSTLTHLTLVNAEPVLEPGLKFPFVTFLSITNRLPAVALPWIETFPNVTHLIYRGGMSDSEHGAKVRSINRYHSHILRDWLKLSRVQGEPCDLSCLGLYRHVDEVILESVQSNSEGHIASVLKIFDPVILRLRVIGPQIYMGSRIGSAIDGILGSSERLSHLEIRILRDLQENEFRPVMTSIINSFKQNAYKLKYKTLFFHILLRSPSNRLFPSTLMPADVLSSFVATLADITQSLEGFSICLQGPPCGVLFWERVTGTSNTMRMLQGDEALQYIRNNVETAKYGGSQ